MAETVRNGPGVFALAKLRALRDSSLDLETSALAVGIVLRENSGTGETMAAVPTLARDAKISRATAWRRLALLVRQGIVVRKRRKGRTSLLSVNLAALKRFQCRRVSQRDCYPSQPETPTPLSLRPAHLRLIDSGLSAGDPNSSTAGLPTKLQDEDATAQEPARFAFSGVHLRITERQDTLLAEAFPWVDRSTEYRKMDSWLEGNLERRPKKHARFAHNWMAKIPAPSGPSDGKTRKHRSPDLSRFENVGVHAADLARRKPPLV